MKRQFGGIGFLIKCKDFEPHIFKISVLFNFHCSVFIKFHYAGQLRFKSKTQVSYGEVDSNMSVLCLLSARFHLSDMLDTETWLIILVFSMNRKCVIIVSNTTQLFPK